MLLLLLAGSVSVSVPKSGLVVERVRAVLTMLVVLLPWLLPLPLSKASGRLLVVASVRKLALLEERVRAMLAGLLLLLLKLVVSILMMLGARGQYEGLEDGDGGE